MVAPVDYGKPFPRSITAVDQQGCCERQPRSGQLPTMVAECYRLHSDRPRRQPMCRATPDTGLPVYRLDTMTQDDVADVSRVERRCFPNPWPASAYRRELQNPQQNAYIVLREVPAGEPVESNGVAPTEQLGSGLSPRPLPRRSLLPMGINRRQEGNGLGREPIVGFAGMWMAFDEAHVTTIGVDPVYRGRGLGELLLLATFDEAMTRGAHWLTLEVRVSNEPAQSLYRKYGFTVQGTRKRYYSDNNEDALIMWSRPLGDADTRAEIEQHRRALWHRLGSEVVGSALSPFTDPLTRATAT
jgi:ribosomal-protein-alanine N-acetyltransferase